MTKDEALRLALEALENSVDLVREHAYNAEELYGNYPARQGKVRGLKVLADDHEKAITAIKAALEAKDEPVAWGVFEGNLHDMFFSQEEAQEMADLKGTHAEVQPLYATPQRTWVGLTDKEQLELYKKHSMDGWGLFYNAIESKLKEKNT